MSKLESSPNPPIIDLDGENPPDVFLRAKSLGYFYISRSSSYGQIPRENSLKMLVQELFRLSPETKLAFGSDYIRSTNLNDPPAKHESLAFTSTSELSNFPKSMSIKTLFNLCQQVSVHLINLFEFTDTSTSSARNNLAFEHYQIPTNEKFLLNRTSDSPLQFHLFSTSRLQRLDSLEQEWKIMNYTSEHDDNILVTLPNFLYRYSIDDDAHYSIHYSAYDSNLEKRTYLLSLTENTTLRYFTFFYLYVMQGVPAGFSSTALANYLTAEGEKSSTVGTFVSLAGLPWALQFVWGPLIDRFQSSPMGRRRPWVISSQMCAFLASLGLLVVGDPPTQFIKTLVIAFFIHSIFASIQDASVDAQAITTIPLHERGRINGFMRAGFLIGSAMGAAGMSAILRTYGYLTCALINSMILFGFTILTFFIKEKSTDQLFPCSSKKSNVKNRRYQAEHDYSIVRLFRELFKGLLSFPSLRLFIPILMVYLCQSAFIRAYSIHLISVLGWSDTSVSILSGAWGTLIVVAVALIGGWLADHIGARRLLIIVMIIHTIYMFIANLVEPHWHKRPVATAVLIIWNMMDPILSTAAMPVLMALCRKHVEGSQFTTYMSMVNLCDLAGAFVSGHLQRYIPANTIGLGCATLITCALVIASFGVWYDQRNTTVTSEKLKSSDRKKLKNCWPMRICTKYRRGTFKIIV